MTDSTNTPSNTTDAAAGLAPVGRRTVRVDGPLKVSGQAPYASDFHFDGMVYAVPVCATIGSGTVAAIDTGKAGAMPGVKKIYTHDNIGTFYRVSKSSRAKVDEKRPPLSDNVIRYYGQYVALVVADTFEHATAAADAVKVTYTGQQPPNVATTLHADGDPKTDTERGDPEGAFAKAATKIDYTYATPFETHNPIELHASLAVWDGSRFTLYETTQGVMNFRAVMAQMLGVPEDRVEVITEYLGSGFGGKLWPWMQAPLAAAAARDLGVPVKLVVSRRMMFHDVGHRPYTQQRLRLSATPEGRLTSLRQDFIYSRALDADYKENCGEGTGFFYSTPNLRVTAAHATRNVGPATSMRGPGAVPGVYALESAMDELALALDIDPLVLRQRNEPDKDEQKNLPFSSRHYQECLSRGAEKFGWSRRKPGIGAMRNDEEVLGWGMAGCTWIAERFAAQAKLLLQSDGGVRVTSGTQDIGTGTYTILAQMAAEMAGVNIDKVKVEIGHSSLPPGPLSGGSMATASLVPAMVGAADDAGSKLLKIASDEDATFKGVDADDLVFTKGRVHRKNQSPEQGRSFAQVLKSAGVSHVEGHGKSEGTVGNKDKKYSFHSFGAHFVEVGWQPDIARLRVNRVVTVIDAGRIINPLAGRNQIEGAVVMGVGMALLERSEYDHRNGMVINSNLADYLMATHADSPELDVEFLDYPDLHLNALGARGIGEIGLAGIPAAITAAVYHATGVRVRKLPLRIEDLLASKVV